MEMGIFYEIQVNSPIEHRERERQALHDRTMHAIDLFGKHVIPHFAAGS